MQKASATLMARKFSEFLSKVEHGRSIRVLKHGRTVARLVPDCDFMEGRRAAEIFAGHSGDAAVADAIAKEISRLRQEEDNRRLLALELINLPTTHATWKSRA